MNKYKILCVDDQEDMLDVIKIYLEPLGHEVITKISCIEALEYIRENSSQILYIFSDYKMDEMNGLIFREKINELVDNIPFSMITGFYNIEMTKQGMALRISAFVEKPFQADELINLFKDLGEKRKLFLDEEFEMVIGFIEESYPMLEEIEDLIMSLETNPDDANLLNTYFRLLHTIKGTASCVGLKNIPKFAHKYEDLVVQLQNKQISLTSEVTDTLLKGLDQLKFLYSEAKNGHFEVNVDEALKIFELSKSSGDVQKICASEKSIIAKPAEVQDAAEEKIGVSISVLDEFMELSGRLTVLRNTLIKSALILEQRYYGDNEIDIVTDSLDEMHKVSSVLQNEIAEMRKVTLEVVYKPLRRVVRDSSKSLNKIIDLQIEGDDLRVDTSISKALSNSLVHMIRNSIDHGIELPGKRVLAGKNEMGTISLKTFQDGENIIVELSDDGNGLSLSRIKQKAIEKNLFTEEQLKQMSDQKIFAIIFDSGFSTAQQVSDISGRGVGMDMVRNSIERTGGNILIDSKEGQGTRFTLTLPIPRSIMIIKSLMIKSNECTYSIPLDEVAEVVRLEDFKNSKTLHSIEDSLMLSHHDELLPLVDLNKLLYNKVHYDEFDVINIVIVRGDGFKYGIIVDEIMDIEEIVVKKMSKHLKNAASFMGITFIGHGALALILNLQAIAEQSHIKCTVDGKKSNAAKAESQVEEQEFMQFNLKKSKNYAFLLHMVNRLEEIPTKDIEFSGAVPLIRYRGEVMPLLFIERQLNLCSRDDSLETIYPDLLKVIVVDLHNKKFGIVVDEILDIGKTIEEFSTLNVDRDGFMGTTFIDEKTITIVDIHYLIDNYIAFEKSNLEEEAERSEIDQSFYENKAA